MPPTRSILLPRPKCSEAASKAHLPAMLMLITARFLPSPCQVHKYSRDVLSAVAKNGNVLYSGNFFTFLVNWKLDLFEHLIYVLEVAKHRIWCRMEFCIKYGALRPPEHRLNDRIGPLFDYQKSKNVWSEKVIFSENQKTKRKMDLTPMNLDVFLRWLSLYPRIFDSSNLGSI